MARRKLPAIPDALLDQLLGGADPRTAFNPDGVLDALKKALAERMLNAEMDQHLGDEIGAGGRANTRNGYGQKTVLTDTGRLALDIPRDRQGTFDPQLIAKYQRRFPGFDEKIVSMYARGMSVREIQGYIRELCGLDISPDLVSAVIDAVLEEVALWQNRPLEPVYPLVFFDALRVKIRDEGLVRNKAIHIALGVRADGTKEVLGLWIEQNEGAKFWLRVMNELKNRGTEDILLAVVDGLRGDPGGFPRGDGADLHRPPAAHFDGLRVLQGSQGRCHCLEGHLSHHRRSCRRRGAGRVRGRTLGDEIPRHRAELAPGLAGGHPVLRLSCRGPPHPLHDKCHRSVERQTAPCGPGTRPFSDRRGRHQASLSGVAPR
jgi:hypothetical protein